MAHRAAANTILDGRPAHRSENRRNADDLARGYVGEILKNKRLIESNELFDLYEPVAVPPVGTHSNLSREHVCQAVQDHNYHGTSLHGKVRMIRGAF